MLQKNPVNLMVHGEKPASEVNRHSAKEMADRTVIVTVDMQPL